MIHFARTFAVHSFTVHSSLTITMSCPPEIIYKNSNRTITKPFPLLPYWRDMSLSSLVEIDYYDEACKGFLADVYATSNAHPQLRKQETSHSNFLAKSVILIVAQITEHLRCFKKDSMTLYNAVCFDGSMGFVRLTFNSGLSHQVRDDGLDAGCTIEIIDHDFIWNQDSDDGVKRAVLFVKQFSIRKGPVTQEGVDDDCTEVTPEHSSVWIHADVLSRCQTQSVMLFCDSFKHENKLVYWAAMSAVKIGRGIMIDDLKVRDAFLAEQALVKKRTAEDLNCKCMSPPYSLTKCVLVAKPIVELDEQELYHACKCRLGEESDGMQFQNLSSSHKRWCYYWYYAVNVFHIGSGCSQELPTCFVDAIRNEYPDVKGKYTGYKRTN
jgi:hypothetical protein